MSNLVESSTIFIIFNRLIWQVEANVGAPQVNYRESISKVSEVKYVHKKQSGGQGQFADITVRFEPLEPGSGSWQPFEQGLVDKLWDFVMGTVTRLKAYQSRPRVEFLDPYGLRRADPWVQVAPEQ